MFKSTKRAIDRRLLAAGLAILQRDKVVCQYEYDELKKFNITEFTAFQMQMFKLIKRSLDDDAHWNLRTYTPVK